MASILLIEDESALQRLLSWVLLNAGFEVSVAKTADDAIARLGDYSPDVIVFNTEMDDEAKNSVISKLRALSPGARILDVSEEKNQLKRGMIGISADGSIADATLDLPFPKERLLGAIQELLEQPAK
jgi:two-component system phosphate regulon response regulator PhoB